MKRHDGKSTGRQLLRLGSTDVVVAEEVLKNAAHLMIPEDQTQRRAFEALMPWMYVLRNRGFSWAQLTSLLTECGFQLQPSTVRTYYSEMLASRLDICQARMNEQLALLEEIRQETRGAELPTIAGRVNSVLAEQRRRAESKVSALFGHLATAAPPLPSDQGGQPSNRPARPDLNRSHHRADQAGNAVVRTSERQRPKPSPAHDRVVTEPSNGPQTANPRADTGHAKPASEQHDPRAVDVKKFECLKLQPGVVPVKQRDGVPAAVYEDGILEHPAIPGLRLNLQERLYGAALEYKDMETGEIHTESPNAKRFRLTWRKQVPKVPTRTDSAFVRMDVSVFRRLPAAG